MVTFTFLDPARPPGPRPHLNLHFSIAIQLRILCQTSFLSLPTK